LRIVIGPAIKFLMGLFLSDCAYLHQLTVIGFGRDAERISAPSARRSSAARAASDANWEFMAHCLTQMPIQAIEDQRNMMGRAPTSSRSSPAHGRRDGSAPAAPDLVDARLRHRMQLLLVRRLGARRPAAMGGHCQQSHLRGALFERNQRHHHDGLASSRTESYSRERSERCRRGRKILESDASGSRIMMPGWVPIDRGPGARVGCVVLSVAFQRSARCAGGLW
jgi:hypothetical protein